MKIAIIGAGPAGLACAHECEKLGEIPDLFERDQTVGWPWPSVTFQPIIFLRDLGSNPNIELRKSFDIDITPIGENKKVIMKSPNKEITLKGTLGYTYTRGKDIKAIANQFFHKLNKTGIHFNAPVDYKELSKKYDFVVVATGKDTEAAELGVWQNQGQVSIMSTIAVGKFDPNLSKIYFNTEYAGTGYGRLSPFNSTQAIISLYIIGHEPFEADRLFSKFLKQEGLENLEFLCTYKQPIFQTGRVSKFQIDNVLLTGRAAGLIERTLGVGWIHSAISGVLAARSIINGLDYETLIKPFQNHVENISTFRKTIEKFDNNEYDRLLTLLGTPGIKQLLYNTHINFADMVGSIIKRFHE